jgi:hypothetical protein
MNIDDHNNINNEAVRDDEQQRQDQLIGRRRRREHDILQQEEPPRARRRRQNGADAERRCPVHNTKLQLWRGMLFLQRNHPRFTTWNCTSLFGEHYDAEFMLVLSGALIHSTHLRRLELPSFSLLNEADATALVQGIRQSRLESLNMVVAANRATHPPEIWKILNDGLPLRTVLEVKFESLADPEIVHGWEDILTIPSLRKLTLDRLFLTEPQAQSLAKGIRESKLESLTISLHAATTKTPHQDKTQTKGLRLLAWWIFLNQGLKKSHTIQEFTFRTDYACVEELVGLAHALPMMHSLRTLVWDGMDVTERVARALAKGIGQSQLTSLTIKLPKRFHRNVMMRSKRGKPCVSMLGKVLAAAAQHGYHPTSSLTKIELMHCDLDRGMISLANGLASKNAMVTSLVLEDCWLGDRAVQILFSQGLRHNTTLTYLKFKRCELGDREVQSIVDNWHADSAIQSLSLQACVKPCVAQTLLGAVAKHPALQELEFINGCDLLNSYEALRIMGNELVHQPYLTRVSLLSCRCSGHNMTPVESTKARDEAGQALIHSVQQNHRIQRLNVEGNFFPNHVMQEIEFYAGLNRTGQYLLSTHHGLASTVWCFILAQCQKQQKQVAASLTYYYLREQPYLVMQRYSKG